MITTSPMSFSQQQMDSLSRLGLTEAKITDSILCLSPLLNILLMKKLTEIIPPSEIELFDKEMDPNDQAMLQHRMKELAQKYQLDIDKFTNERILDMFDFLYKLLEKKQNLRLIYTFDLDTLIDICDLLESKKSDEATKLFIQSSQGYQTSKKTTEAY